MLIVTGLLELAGLSGLHSLLLDSANGVAIGLLTLGGHTLTVRLKTRRPVLPDDAARVLAGYFPWAFWAVVAFGLIAWGLL